MIENLHILHIILTIEKFVGLKITYRYTQALQRIIVCAQLADDISTPVTHAADECARLLLGAVQWRGEEMLSESLLTYAVHAVERSRSEARLLLVLDFTTVVGLLDTEKFLIRFRDNMIMMVTLQKHLFESIF